MNARAAAVRYARMAARDVAGLCALIACYVLLAALGLALAFVLFPELPAPSR